MPNDPRPELQGAPDLTIDEVRELARRAAGEAEEERARSYDLIRKTHALFSVRMKYWQGDDGLLDSFS